MSMQNLVKRTSTILCATAVIVFCDVAFAQDISLEDLPDDRPFAKGDMELGLGLGGWGNGDQFTLTVGGTFAYYVVNRLAPGLQLNYQTSFGDLEYPQSITTLPFLKFVLIRSMKFAPYLIVAGGREFQWGGTDNPSKGFKAVGSWIIGGGAGAHVGIGAHFALKLQVLALHYTFDKKILLAGDKDAVNSKLFFPVISMGLSIMF